MSKIYTRTGDGGKTSLRLGVRVEKDDPRIEVNGQTDQLNAILGIVRCMLPKDSDDAQFIEAIQNQLMDLMSYVATSGQTECKTEKYLSQTRQMEQLIDGKANLPTFHFDIPGSCTLNGFLHLARTQCRTVERRLWTLNRTYPMDDCVLHFLNRLSDYLFALAVSVQK